MLSSDPWPLVGRDNELARVAEVLASSGATGIVLAGPGGVGKTRLGRECIALAEHAGYRVARALATRSSAQIPLGALATLLPAEGDAPSGLSSARAALAALAEQQPLLLLVDDAHLLDDLSATVVLSAASDPQIFPVLTIRTGEPGPDAVTALWKDAGAVRVDLAPIDTPAVGELLALVLGGAVAPDTVARLARLSGGTPLALRELVDGALHDGTLVVQDGTWCLSADPKVPDRLAELLGERLDRIGPGAIDLVATLALTEPLPITAVERLGLLDDLEALERARIVSITDLRGDESAQSWVATSTDVDAGLSARLDHPLYGEVALERIGEVQRRRVLASCAAALSDGAPSRQDELRAILWRLWAGEAMDPAALMAAANRSYQMGDYAGTRELAAAAWRTQPSFASGHLLGFALGQTHATDEATAVLAEATALAADDRELALITVTHAEVMLRGQGRPAEATDLCLAAERSITDPAWRAEVTTHRAMGMVQCGAIDDALVLIQPVLDDPDPDPRAFVRAAYAAGIALVHACRPDDATDVALRALPVHEALWTDDFFQTEPGVHHLTTLFALVGSGRYLEAAMLLGVGREMTRGLLPRYGYAWISFISGMNAVQQGLAGDAADHFAEAAPIFGEADQVMSERWCWAGLALAEAMRGDGPAATRHLATADALEVPGLDLNRPWVSEARGWTQIACGDLAAGQATFDAEADHAIATGDLLGASRLLHSLARSGGSSVGRLDDLHTRTQSPMISLRARHARLLAGRRTVTGSGVENDALADDLEAVGAFLHAAEAAAEASRSHVRNGGQRAGTRSRERSLDLLERCQGARSMLTLVDQAHEPLTAREREIATLAVGRLSSKEIAERLHLSPRTVDNHLQRVYRKLGVSSRTDLATALHLS